MPRVKRAVNAQKKRRKVLEEAKGYWGLKSTNYKYAKEQVERSLAYAYRDRKVKKRSFRRLWIIRINAGARANGLSYNQFISGLKAAGVEPAINVKVILDSEEEKGSVNIGNVATAHRELLRADAILIHDGPRHASEKPTLVFGNRGNTTVRLTVYGPRNELHSGHYGNYAPNPALRLAKLLASMKDDDGRVTIEGFYAGVNITAADRLTFADVGDDEPALRVGVLCAEGAHFTAGLDLPTIAPLMQRGEKAVPLGLVDPLNLGMDGYRRRTKPMVVAVQGITYTLGIEADPSFFTEAEPLFRTWQATGVPFFQTLRREPWGARTFIVRDPDGNLILFAGPDRPDAKSV